MADRPQEALKQLLRATVPTAWAAAVCNGDADALVRESSDPVTSRSVAKAVAEQGWLTPEWPERYGGRGLDSDQAVAVRRVLARWRVGRVDSAVGAGWVGPAILTYGTDQQRARLLPPIARNEEFWCQLFSEPEAGSDLASLRTRARREGDQWVISGDKIWNSRVDIAAWGLTLVRTDGTVPKHAGITCFCIPTDAPGLHARPIRQMTGDAEFFEVRLDEVRVPDSLRLGEPGQGWEIARAVLAFERRAGSGLGAAPPGSVVGRDVNELLAQHLAGASPAQAVRLTDAWIDSRLVALNNERNAALIAAGRPPIAHGTPFNKILQAEASKRLQSLRMELGGPAIQNPLPEDASGLFDQWAYLRVQPKTVAGGTSEVLRDQVAERGLGLPRSDDPSRSVPWDDFVRRMNDHGEG